MSFDLSARHSSPFPYFILSHMIQLKVQYISLHFPFYSLINCSIYAFPRVPPTLPNHTLPPTPFPHASPLTAFLCTYPQTMLNCIDNSGAAIVECVQVLKMKRHAKIGDRIVVVVQKQRSLGAADVSGAGGSAAAAAAGGTKVRRGDIRHAIVVRTKKKYGRPDGSFVRFDDNACVLINKAGEPIGTRLNGMPSPLLGGSRHLES